MTEHNHRQCEICGKQNNAIYFKGKDLCYKCIRKQSKLFLDNNVWHIIKCSICRKKIYGRGSQKYCDKCNRKLAVKRTKEWVAKNK